MIYNAEILIEEGGRLIIRSPRTVSEYIGRAVAGSFFLGVGTLVLYTFVSGGGPTPAGSGAQLLVGWLTLAAVTFALGVLPFAWGFTDLFVTRSFCINSAQNHIESRLMFCGLTVWSRRYPFRIFDHVTIRHYRSGFPVTRDRFLVSAEASSLRMRLSTSTDTSASEHLALAIATEVKVPIARVELNDKTRSG